MAILQNLIYMQPVYFRFITLVAFLTLSAEARTFKDDMGREIEAEMTGVNGENVVLSKGGQSFQWPVAKLSKVDQQYVSAWKSDPATTPSVVVNVWEREGIGSAGLMDGKGGLELPKNIPLLKTTEEKEKYRYYDVDLSNNSQVDANKVHLKYVIYVIDASNKIVDFPGQEDVDAIPARQKVTVVTKAATMIRAKTTSATFGVNPLGGLTTGSSTDRSTERFGGIWARAYSHDGKLLGERKQLHDELERLDLPWTAAPVQEFADIPLLESFEKLEEFLKSLPKLPDSIKPPSGLPKPPSGLPKPPSGLPKPPFSRP